MWRNSDSNDDENKNDKQTDKQTAITKILHRVWSVRTESLDLLGYSQKDFVPFRFRKAHAFSVVMSEGCGHISMLISES